MDSVEGATRKSSDNLYCSSPELSATSEDGFATPVFQHLQLEQRRVDREEKYPDQETLNLAPSVLFKRNERLSVSQQDDEELRMGILMSQQESRFGMNMFNSFNAENDGKHFNQLCEHGISINDAYLLIFESKVRQLDDQHHHQHRKNASFTSSSTGSRPNSFRTSVESTSTTEDLFYQQQPMREPRPQHFYTSPASSACTSRTNSPFNSGSDHGAPRIQQQQHPASKQRRSSGSDVFAANMAFSGHFSQQADRAFVPVGAMTAAPRRFEQERRHTLSAERKGSWPQESVSPSKARQQARRATLQPVQRVDHYAEQLAWTQQHQFRSDATARLRVHDVQCMPALEPELFPTRYVENAHYQQQQHRHLQVQHAQYAHHGEFHYPLQPHEHAQYAQHGEFHHPSQPHEHAQYAQLPSAAEHCDQPYLTLRDVTTPQAIAAATTTRSTASSASSASQVSASRRGSANSITGGGSTLPSSSSHGTAVARDVLVIEKEANPAPKKTSLLSKLLHPFSSSSASTEGKTITLRVYGTGGVQQIIVKKKHVKALLKLGYREEAVLQALAESNNDRERALEMLSRLSSSSAARSNA